MTSDPKLFDRPVGVNALAGRETLTMLMGIFEAARIVPRTAPAFTLPLTIISGFLGAGKTTLVNRLLADPAGRRIAVLVNDFAAVNIDEELIRFRSGDTIGLTNGCACCSINGDLVRAIQRLVERSDPPDAIMLEASGIADPRGIAQIALANPTMRLDAVITLIDAETFLERLHDERTRSTLIAQISAADIIAINKTDLVQAQRSEIRQAVESISPRRVVLETTHGNVPTEVALGAGRQGSSIFACSPGDHAAGFSSATRTWNDPLDRGAIERALRELPPYVIRAKGTFSLKGESRRYVYQRVGAREAFEPSSEPDAPGPESRLVLIGFSDDWKEAELSALL